MLSKEEELRSVRERLSELECRLAALETNGRSPALGLRLRRLSTTERRVLELVVAGLTTDVVADRLFLSTKTVAWNLTKVCRKLGVDSAEELAALLRPNGETPGGSLSGAQPESQGQNGGESTIKGPVTFEGMEGG